MNGSNRFAVTADHIFDGRTKHKNAAVVIEGSQIISLVPRSELTTDLSIQSLPVGFWLAPGFIDLQVNGGGDVLFNESPTPETITKMVAAHRKFGTTALLPTLITDTFAKMKVAKAACESLVGKDPSVLGIHLEGPFLSPEKAGAHDPNLIRTPSRSDLEMLCANRRGTLLMTLAPERVPREFIGRLVKSGVRVSLGHSMATYAETCAATAEGLTGFTHLFNAMRPLTSREPGPIGSALESADVSFGMIVDGFHVDPVVLRIALRGLGRPMLVTDAMPPVGGCRSNFYLYGREIRFLDGRCLRADGTLAGAALDMAAAVRNCVNLLQVPIEDALRFASRNPAEFIGLGDRLGKLCPGHRADMVAIDPETVTVWATWVAGAREFPGVLTGSSGGSSPAITSPTT
jgi:N-acetylglucosamine-6-phosphate deacetylase